MPSLTSAFHVFAVTIQRGPSVSQWPLDVSTGLCKQIKALHQWEALFKGIYLFYKPSLTLSRVHSSHPELPCPALSTGRGWQLHWPALLLRLLRAAASV